MKHIDLQGQVIYNDKNKSKKSLRILKDYANGVQVGDIEQTTKYLNVFLNMIKIHQNCWLSTTYCDNALKWITNSRDMEKRQLDNI